MMDKYGVKVSSVDENELSIRKHDAHPQSPWVSVNRWNGREWLYTGDVDYWMPIPAIPKEVNKQNGNMKRL